MDKEGDTSL
jgi:hypothetical protein